LCSTPVLAAPTAEGDFVLDVDASTFGAGASLHQYQAGVLRVICYASRQFNNAERPYCTTHQELDAVVFGLNGFGNISWAVEFWFGPIMQPSLSSGMLRNLLASKRVG